MPLDLARVQALVFDVDGTLSDTDDHLVAQIAGVLDALPLLSGRRAAELARRIVMGAESPVNAAYGAIDRYGLDDELAALKGLLTRAIAQRNRAERHPAEAADEVPHDLVPDVAEMLRALAPRYPMSAFSTGGEVRIRAFLAHHGVADLFAAVVGAQTTPRMKPYPDPLVYAAEAMNVAPEACLVIGDTTVDMETARAVGAQAVGVLCGFGTEDELVREGADLVLATTSDLLAVLAPARDALGASADPAAPPAHATVPSRPTRAGRGGES
ncbi:HAD family hydrolase [Rubrivirga sp. S365]|uniref:HAD family hydrolase n=1 Tax=Rubrivirga sp. S365 TaxID=3076080 RepID=UPI0028CAE519|nr:HAD family hydrolase [Rubrivirga sp. S365]MDT7856685.1 HAD family hydrolase [Rubrivirga sp. S365]